MCLPEIPSVLIKSARKATINRREKNCTKKKNDKSQKMEHDVWL